MSSLGSKMGNNPSVSPHRQATVSQQFSSASRTFHVRANYLELSYNADSDSVDGGRSLGICSSDELPCDADVTSGWGTTL